MNKRQAKKRTKMFDRIWDDVYKSWGVVHNLREYKGRYEFYNKLERMDGAPL